MSTPENLAATVTAAAVAIAKDKSSDELDLLAAIFSQLGDTLATISTARGRFGDGSEHADKS